MLLPFDSSTKLPKQSLLKEIKKLLQEPDPWERIRVAVKNCQGLRAHEYLGLVLHTALPIIPEISSLAWDDP